MARKTAGLMAIAFYVIHAAVHLARREPFDLLWECHLGALLVGLGLLTGSARVNAIGTLWGCFGLPLWIVSLSTGGDFLPTSVLTHIGGLAIGCFGVHELGMPPGSWWRALAASIVLWLLTRIATPATANVNLAFSVAAGWERLFPNYLAYGLTLFGGSALGFWIAERLFRRLVRRTVKA